MQELPSLEWLMAPRRVLNDKQMPDDPYRDGIRTGTGFTDTIAAK